jgi:hypothetical protein
MSSISFIEWAASMQDRFYFLTGKSAPWEDFGFLLTAKLYYRDKIPVRESADILANDFFIQKEVDRIIISFHENGLPILSWFDGISNGAMVVLKREKFKAIRNGDKLCFDISLDKGKLDE